MQLATLVKVPNEAMLVYMNRAIAIKTKLLALEADFNEADIVRRVLTGLRNDDRYTITVKVITYSSELPDLTKLTRCWWRRSGSWSRLLPLDDATVEIESPSQHTQPLAGSPSPPRSGGSATRSVTLP